LFEAPSHHAGEVPFFWGAVGDILEVCSHSSHKWCPHWTRRHIAP
jgi:hypothetical protein